MALHVVTGAFSYSGRYITRRLLEAGHTVKTLTGHPHRRDPFDGAVEAMPYHFDDPVALARSLAGAETLTITYWIRFEYGGMTFRQAVANTKKLFDAAQQAGVRRVVYVSIANPHRGREMGLPYYAGKADLEDTLQASSLSHAILRPTVLFGATPGEDVLINNIAYLLRRLPVFGVPGRGDYPIQPMHVDELARMAVEAGQRSDNLTRDAVGPDVFSFKALLQRIKMVTGSRALLVNLPPGLAWLGSRALSVLLDDMLLTRDEVKGLMGGLLKSDEAAQGETSLAAWLEAHDDQLGQGYASELARHYR